jgi:hypothetical protein
VSLLINWLHPNSPKCCTDPHRNCCQHSNSPEATFTATPATTTTTKNNWNGPKKSTAHVPERPTSTGVDRSLDKFFRPPPPPQKRRNVEQFLLPNWRTGSLFILQDPTVFQKAVVKIDPGAQRQPLAKVLFEQTTKWAELQREPCLVVVVVVVGPDFISISLKYHVI